MWWVVLTISEEASVQHIPQAGGCAMTSFLEDSKVVVEFVVCMVFIANLASAASAALPRTVTLLS